VDNLTDLGGPGVKSSHVVLHHSMGRTRAWRRNRWLETTVNRRHLPARTSKLRKKVWHAWRRSC